MNTRRFGTTCLVLTSALASVLALGPTLAAPAFALPRAADDAPAKPADGAAAAEKPVEKPVEKTAEDLAREQAKKELDAMQAELQRLSTEYQLMQQRQKNSLAAAELEKQEIGAKAALDAARLEQELAETRAFVARSQSQMQAEKVRGDLANAEVEKKLAQQALEGRVTASKLEAELEALRMSAQKLQSENVLRAEEVKRAQMEAQIAKQSFDVEMAALRNSMELRATRDTAIGKIVDPVDRKGQPLEGRTLWVSDRRISLNGPIYAGTADYVCDRIDFFNNASPSEPIFIVIDSSPGGSVMEGYRIVKAIETSRAPIHVVVKSFAASMAAIITTLAPNSYALPNAIILHHQMSSGMSGNLTQQKEQLKNSMEWARRLAEPLATKMGLNYEDLVKRMYEHNSNGDWQEFADKAVELKWVDHTVDEIRECALRDQPAGSRASLPFFFEQMKYDDKGVPFCTLPPLMPFDHYFMYDPNDFWR